MLFFSLFSQFVSSKRNFIDSEWDVYATLQSGRKTFTAEVHPIENYSFYFSFWSDDGKNDKIIQTPDEAALITATFGFLSQNTILCDAQFRGEKYHFEAPFLKNEQNKEYLDLKVNDFTTLTITFHNDSFISANLVQIGKGKIAALNAISHDQSFKVPFRIPTKYITYGAVGLFIILQLRTMYKNIKEVKVENEQQKMVKAALNNIKVIPNEKEDEKENENEKKESKDAPQQRNKNKKKKSK